MESRAIREDTTPATTSTKNNKHKLDDSNENMFNAHSSIGGEKSTKGDGDEGLTQKKEKRRKTREDEKGKEKQLPGLGENEGVPLHYTPIVWNQIHGIIGDVPPARSFHTATAVPAHIRPAHHNDKDGKEKEQEEEQARIGCEQILIIGGKRNEADEAEDPVRGDVYLLTLSDEGMTYCFSN